MKTQHTKGEWKAEGNSLVDANRIVATESHVICRITGADFESDEEMEANAKLIAAAPDLLEALKIFIDSTMPYDKKVEVARKAIKKAQL